MKNQFQTKTLKIQTKELNIIDEKINHYKKLGWKPLNVNTSITSNNSYLAIITFIRKHNYKYLGRIIQIEHILCKIDEKLDFISKKIKVTNRNVDYLKNRNQILFTLHLITLILFIVSSIELKINIFNSIMLLITIALISLSVIYKRKIKDYNKKITQYEERNSKLLLLQKKYYKELDDLELSN